MMSPPPKAAALLPAVQTAVRRPWERAGSQPRRERRARRHHPSRAPPVAAGCSATEQQVRLGRPAAGRSQPRLAWQERPVLPAVTPTVPSRSSTVNAEQPAGAHEAIHSASWVWEWPRQPRTDDEDAETRGAPADRLRPGSRGERTGTTAKAQRRQLGVPSQSGQAPTRKIVGGGQI